MATGSPATFQYAHTEEPASFNANVRAPVECRVCHHMVMASAASWDPRLGALCPPCNQSAEWLDKRFERAVQLHRDEYSRQLAQLIRDRAAGAPDPDFYRGDIA